MNDFQSDRFKIDTLIGEGNFGSVYKALDIKTGMNVAIKIEKPCKISQLDTEVEVLQSLSNEKGFAKLISYGKYNEHKYVVMSLLGQNLQKKMMIMRKIISTDVVIEIGLQCLQRIKSLHEQFYIHRDLKPQQYLVDSDLNVSLIDFGLCKKYLNKKMMIHIPYSDNRPFVGTINYASLNTHLGIQQSRRDDLESFCYILSFLIKGKLPWISRNRRFTEKEIKKIKTNLIPSNLFSNPSLIQFFIYVKGLQFEKAPDYSFLLNLVNKALEEEKVRSLSRETCNEISICSTKSKTKIRKKTRKNTVSNTKFKRSNFCKTLDDFSISIFDNSGTEVYEKKPEIRDRKILDTKFMFEVECSANQEKHICSII